MVLERVEEDASGELLKWLGAGTLADNLRRLEDGEQLDAAPPAALEWWIAMPPKIADTNLGPYLRLAASLRRRTGPRSDLRTAQLQPRRMGDTQVEALEPLGPTRRPRRRRARPPFPAVPLPLRRQPRLLPPPHGQPLRCLQDP